MPIVARQQTVLTIEDFDAFVDVQADATLFELVDGSIVEIANPTEFHEQIAGNIGAPLKLAMDERNCRIYQGGRTYQGRMRVQRSENRRETDKPRPDILVRCGAQSNRTFVTDALVIVEVLSPSTID